jgi:hypothetical protein
MVNWVANGTLVDTVSHTGVAGVTVTIADASNSTNVYGTVTTGANGNFECTIAFNQSPNVQLIFAGNNQYLATTSTIELPPA